MTTTDADGTVDQGHEALQFMLDAWRTALEEGLDPDMLANAALFTALSGLVSNYGEDAVVKLATSLPRRIESGEFSSKRTLQ